jgi:hypothetical protein
MALLPFPLAGPTYTNRSLPVSSQVTRGFYLEANSQGNEGLVLMPFPGLKPFSTGVGANRGMGRLKNVLYTISGNNLYKVASTGTQTLIGTIAGNDRCSLEEDQAGNLTIATGVTKPYSYDGSTLTLGTDIDLTNSATVTYINRRVVYDGTDGDIAFADLSAPLSVNSANVIIAEAKPDNMKAVLAYKQQVYAFGETSIQPLYNSGTGNPPYSFIINAVQEIGLAATHSIGTNKNFAYFLGSDLNVYQLTGLDSRPISNPAIGQAISKYSSVDDAYGLCFTFDSLNFYLLSFPSGNETWLFNEQSGLWTNLASGVNGDQHLISDYQFIYGKHLVSDRKSGNIYELDFETFTDNGATIQRRRDTLAISGATFGQPNAEVFMSKLGIKIEPGASLISGAAQMMMEFSDDNGRSWSTELWSPVGELGDYTFEIEWSDLGSFKNRMFRFTMSDPIKWVLISAWADVELSNG